MKHMITLFLITFPFFLIAQDISHEVLVFIQADDVGAFEKYIENGNDISKCMVLSDLKYSFLSLAIKMNSQKIFDKCIELKADLEQICVDKTPLIYAVKYDRADMLVSLLKAGADRNQKSIKGRSAKEYAKKYERPHLANLLE